MPPKKGKKGGGKKEPLDDTTEKLWRAYRRHLQAAGLTMPRKLYEKFMELRDEKHP